MSSFDTLGLASDAKPEAVKARWRELASEHHPDRGGDATEFHIYRQAYEAALILAEQPKVCATCGGAGKTTVVRGFNQVMVTCAACRGSGAK